MKNTALMNGKLVNKMDWRNRYENPVVGSLIKLKSYNGPIDYDIHRNEIGKITKLLKCNYYDYEVLWENGDTSYVKKDDMIKFTPS